MSVCYQFQEAQPDYQRAYALCSPSPAAGGVSAAGCSAGVSGSLLDSSTGLFSCEEEGLGDETAAEGCCCGFSFNASGKISLKRSGRKRSRRFWVSVQISSLFGSWEGGTR